MHCIPFNFLLFFFNDTATTEIYTLSLHDALPISQAHQRMAAYQSDDEVALQHLDAAEAALAHPGAAGQRSEEHTSELQSRFDLVCRLLLEKKKNKQSRISRHYT